jgi:transglutaminase-like putative cysteine protease
MSGVGIAGRMCATAGLLGLAAQPVTPIRALCAAAAVAVWLPRGRWSSGVSVAVGVATAVAAVGLSTRGVLAAALAWAVAHRAATGPVRDRVGWGLAPLALVAGAADGASPLGLLAVVGWAGAAALALLPPGPQLPRGWLNLAGGVWLASAALFFVLPRGWAVGTGDRDAPPRTGFSPEVALDRADAPVDTQDGPLFSVAITPPQDGAVLLRGVPLDRFDGRGWSTDLSPQVAVPPAGAGTIQLVFRRLDAGAGSGLLTAGTVRGLQAEGVVRRLASGGWSSEDPWVAYTVVADPPLGEGARNPERPPGPADVEIPSLDPRVQALADALPGPEAVRAWLDTRTYRRAPVPAAADPVAAFLFGTQAGHCEQFASAAAVLLRAQGIPARLVTGYRAEVRDGRARVSSRDAHAWVEWWDGADWVALDPTPAMDSGRPWWLAVSDYDPVAQAAAARRLLSLARDGAPLVGIALLVLALAVGARRWAGLPRDPVERAHAAARRRLAGRGWQVPESLPPLAAARWVAERSHDAEAGAALVALAELLYAVRWGGASAARLADRARMLGHRAGGARPRVRD